MKKSNRIFILATAFALFCSQVQGQDCGKTCVQPCAPANDCCEAYCDSGKASYYSALIPIGALVIAAIIIATTSGSSGKKHHKGGKGGGGRDHICIERPCKPCVGHFCPNPCPCTKTCH